MCWLKSKCLRVCAKAKLICARLMQLLHHIVTFYIGINSIILCTAQYCSFLQGSLPLVMMFDLPDHLEIDDSEVQKIQDELDVGISIKPKQRQSNKSVMIKAQVRWPCIRGAVVLWTY